MHFADSMAAAVLIWLSISGSAALSAAVVAPAPRLTAAPRALSLASDVPVRRQTVLGLCRAGSPAMIAPFVPVPVLPAGLLPWTGLLPEALVLTTTLFAGFAATGQRMLTRAGLIHAWLLSLILWGTLGWKGFLTGVVYLFCGSAVTKVGKAKKESLGIAEARGGQRGPENVWGSAATAAICALGYAWAPELCGAVPAAAAVRLAGVRSLLLIGFVASLATKLGDTSASEIGKAYGKTTYLATTFKKERAEPPAAGGAFPAHAAARPVFSPPPHALSSCAPLLTAVPQPLSSSCHLVNTSLAPSASHAGAPQHQRPLGPSSNSHPPVNLALRPTFPCPGAPRHGRRRVSGGHTGWLRGLVPPVRVRSGRQADASRRRPPLGIGCMVRTLPRGIDAQVGLSARGVGRARKGGSVSVGSGTPPSLSSLQTTNMKPTRTFRFLLHAPGWPTTSSRSSAPRCRARTAGHG